MTQSQDAWGRLGRLMRARRVELGGANRSKYLNDRGLTQSQYRLLMDMENGKRENFEQSSIDLVEYIYEWEPGSVTTILKGGRPTPRITYTTPVEEPSSAPLVRIEETIGLDDDDARAFADRVIADRFLGDDARIHLLHQYGLLRRIPSQSQAGDIDRPPLRAVAEHGDPADRAELRRLAREAREGYEAQQKGSGDQGDDHR